MTTRHFIILLLTAFLSVTAGGCGREDVISSGQSDNVAGFLFVSDTRETTRALVDSMEHRDLPVKVSWTIDDTTYSTEDPARIGAIYRSMSEMILVGQVAERVVVGSRKITFYLKDGTECPFEFEKDNYLRISDQNYMLESNGQLWDLLESYNEA